MAKHVYFSFPFKEVVLVEANDGTMFLSAIVPDSLYDWFLQYVPKAITATTKSGVPSILKEPDGELKHKYLGISYGEE